MWGREGVNEGRYRDASTIMLDIYVVTIYCINMEKIQLILARKSTYVELFLRIYRIRISYHGT